MSNINESLPLKNRNLLHEFAAHQGAAYRAFGDALERYSKGQINTAELLKTSSNLYFTEAGRAASELFGATAEFYSSAFSAVGGRTKKAEQPETPSSKSASR